MGLLNLLLTLLLCEPSSLHHWFRSSMTYLFEYTIVYGLIHV